MYFNLNRYCELLEQYVNRFGNARMRSEYKTLCKCKYCNYKKARATTIELIKDDLLPSMKEIEYALANFNYS